MNKILFSIFCFLVSNSTNAQTHLKISSPANIICFGMENNLIITSNSTKTGDFNISINDSFGIKLKKTQTNSFILLPTKPVQTAEMIITDKTNKTTESKKIHIYIPTLNLKSGSMSIADFKLVNSIKFDQGFSELGYNVARFNSSFFIRKIGLKNYESKGSLLDECREIYSYLSAGDVILFHDILCKIPNGTVFKLDSFSVTLK